VGSGSAGGVNTGTGGAGGNSTNGFAGGSGVIILSIPTSIASVTFSGGVTQTSSVVGVNRVYIVTATSTTSETVTLA
jgi:hypothetical protein